MTSVFPLEATQYEILHQIARSATADVVVARCIPKNKLVAIKQIDLESVPIMLSQLAKEVAFWASMSHPNAISYYGSFTVENELWFLTEYVDGGSLRDILYEYHPQGITNETIIASILQKVLIFLDYFHGNRRIHRDLQTKNILMNMNGEVRVGGFWNASTLIEQGARKRARNTVLELSCYAAPEAIIDSDKGYKQLADIWSLGITAIELATGKLPFMGMNPVDQITAVTKGPPPTLPDNFSSAFRDFVKECLNITPEKRASAHHLLKHKFIVSGKDSKYIESTFMSQLPPFIQRVEMKSHHMDDEIMKEAEMIKTDYKFDFGKDFEEKPQSVPPTHGTQQLNILTSPPSSEEMKVTKKGRFTLTVNQSNVNQSNVTVPVLMGDEK